MKLTPTQMTSDKENYVKESLVKKLEHLTAKDGQTKCATCSGVLTI